MRTCLSSCKTDYLFLARGYQNLDYSLSCSFNLIYFYVKPLELYDLTLDLSISFVKRDPVSTIVEGLRMKYDNLSFIPIPSMIPSTTHIQI